MKTHLKEVEITPACCKLVWDLIRTFGAARHSTTFTEKLEENVSVPPGIIQQTSTEVIYI